MSGVATSPSFKISCYSNWLVIVVCQQHDDYDDGYLLLKLLHLYVRVAAFATAAAASVLAALSACAACFCTSDWSC